MNIKEQKDRLKNIKNAIVGTFMTYEVIKDTKEFKYVKEKFFPKPKYSKKVKDILQKAMKASESSDFNLALHYAKSALDIEPFNSEIYNLISLIYIELKDYKNALKYSQNSIVYALENINQARYFGNMADIYFYLREWQSSIDACKNQISINKSIGFRNPLDYWGYWRFGLCHKYLFELEDAKLFFSNALKLKDDIPRIWNQFSYSLYYTKQFNILKKSLDKTLNILNFTDSNDADFRLDKSLFLTGIGLWNFEMGNYNSAKNYFLQGISIYENNPQPYFELAKYQLIVNQDFNKFEICLKKFISYLDLEQSENEYLLTQCLNDRIVTKNREYYKALIELVERNIKDKPKRTKSKVSENTKDTDKFFFQEVNELIAANKIEKAIDKLLSFPRLFALEKNLLISIKASYNQYKVKVMKGIDQKSEYNEILDRLLRAKTLIENSS